MASSILLKFDRREGRRPMLKSWSVRLKKKKVLPNSKVWVSIQTVLFSKKSQPWLWFCWLAHKYTNLQMTVFHLCECFLPSTLSYVYLFWGRWFDAPRLIKWVARVAAWTPPLAFRGWWLGLDRLLTSLELVKWALVPWVPCLTAYLRRRSGPWTLDPWGSVRQTRRTSLRLGTHGLLVWGPP